MNKKKYSKKNQKKNIYTKKKKNQKGGLIPMQNNSLQLKSSICHKITEEFRDSLNPIKKLKFRGKCKEFENKGEKICDIIWSRYNPLFGEADPDPSWRPKQWCVSKKKRNNNSIKNLYKKGELNETTNIGQILNELEEKKKEEH